MCVLNYAVLNQILTSLCVRERRKGDERELDDEDHVVCCTVHGCLPYFCSCIIPAALLQRSQDESLNLEQHNKRFAPQDAPSLLKGSKEEDPFSLQSRGTGRV